MNSKYAKSLRGELFHTMGVKYNDTKYQTQLVRWITCPPKGANGKPVLSQWPVHFGGILIGFAIPVLQYRLKPDCGRAIYRKAKKLLDTGT